MTKNTTMDVWDHLVAQMERLDDENLSEEELQKEIKRAGAMSTLATSMAELAAIQIKAYDRASDMGADAGVNLPNNLIGRK